MPQNSFGVLVVVSRRLMSGVTDRVIVGMAVVWMIAKRSLRNDEVILRLDGLEVVGSLNMIGLIEKLVGTQA